MSVFWLQSLSVLALQNKSNGCCTRLFSTSPQRMAIAIYWTEAQQVWRSWGLELQSCRNWLAAEAREGVLMSSLHRVPHTSMSLNRSCKLHVTTQISKRPRTISLLAESRENPTRDVSGVSCQRQCWSDTKASQRHQR